MGVKLDGTDQSVALLGRCNFDAPRTVRKMHSSPNPRVYRVKLVLVIPPSVQITMDRVGRSHSSKAVTLCHTKPKPKLRSSLNETQSSVLCKRTAALQDLLFSGYGRVFSRRLAARKRASALSRRSSWRYTRIASGWCCPNKNRLHA